METGTAAPSASVDENIVVDPSGVTLEPEDIIDQIFDKAHEIAKEQGIDTSNITEDELLDLLPPEGEPIEGITETDNLTEEINDGNETTTESDAVQKNDVPAEKEDTTPPANKPEETLSDMDKLRRDVETSNRNYEELRQLQGRQTTELGDLRQYRQQNAPMIDKLNADPSFRNHVLNYYPDTGQPAGQTQIPADFDPTNAGQLQKFVQQNVSAALQNRDKMTQAQRVRANAQAQRNNLMGQIGAGEKYLVDQGVQPEEAKKYVANVFQKLTSDIPGLVESLQKADNIKSEIDAAYQKGANEAVQKLNSNKKTVRTTSASNNARIDKTAQDKDTTEMNGEEWQAHMTKLMDTDPDRWDREMATAEARVAANSR